MKKVIISALIAGFAASLSAQTLHIYTARHYDADSKLYDLFTQKTGIKIKATQAKVEELLKKLELEGENSPADIFITADVSNLTQAKELGVLASVSSKALDKVVPANLKDSDNSWYAITKRARVIVYDKENNKNPSIKTYEDLANPKYKGQILVRSAKSPYQKTLLASIIANDGEEKALKWAMGVKDNLAQTPKGGDRDQAKALINDPKLGAKYAVMNTYYIGLMLTSKNPKDVEVAERLGVIFPNQNGRGTHINISGAGVVKASQNKDDAVKFIEFLLSPEAQSILTEINYEYPVNQEVAPSAVISSLGQFKEDKIPLSKIAKNVKQAVIIYDKAGFR